MQILKICGHSYMYNKIYISQKSVSTVELDILQIFLK